MGRNEVRRQAKNDDETYWAGMKYAVGRNDVQVRAKSLLGGGFHGQGLVSVGHAELVASFAGDDLDVEIG